jgi:hypothetical protein
VARSAIRVVQKESACFAADFCVRCFRLQACQKLRGDLERLHSALVHLAGKDFCRRARAVLSVCVSYAAVPALESSAAATGGAAAGKASLASIAAVCAHASHSILGGASSVGNGAATAFGSATALTTTAGAAGSTTPLAELAGSVFEQLGSLRSSAAHELATIGQPNFQRRVSVCPGLSCAVILSPQTRTPRQRSTCKWKNAIGALPPHSVRCSSLTVCVLAVCSLGRYAATLVKRVRMKLSGEEADHQVWLSTKLWRAIPHSLCSSLLRPRTADGRPGARRVDDRSGHQRRQPLPPLRRMGASVCRCSCHRVLSWSLSFVLFLQAPWI